MALSGTEITRIGTIGFPGQAYLGFTPKEESDVIVPPSLGSGGDPYGRKRRSRILRPLSEYEERVRILLEREKKEKQAEKRSLKAKVVRREAKSKTQEVELETLMLRDVIQSIDFEIIRVNKDLRELKKRSISKLDITDEDELLLLMIWTD